MNKETYDFKNKVIGFVKQAEVDLIFVALEERGITRDRLDCLDQEERRKLMENLEHSSNLWTRLRISADKAIGSGPSELMRDIKQAPADEYMLCIETHHEKQKEEIFDILKAHDATKMKYFHPLYTEHGTTEPGHRQEIFPVE
jgi:hypothetical protein